MKPHQQLILDSLVDIVAIVCLTILVSMNRLDGLVGAGFIMAIAGVWAGKQYQAKKQDGSSNPPPPPNPTSGALMPILAMVSEFLMRR